MHNLPLETRGLLGAIFVFVLFFAVLSWIIKKLFPHAKRPPPITTLCIVFSFGLFRHIQMLFAYQNMTWQDIFFSFINIVLGIAVIVGIWRMKRWGVIGYVIITSISQFYILLQGGGTIFQTLFIFPLFILFYYYSKMR